MKLILNGINGHYLRNITENRAADTAEVIAAAAYATDDTLLFQWCLKHQIPLKFYGRLDADVPVSAAILKNFLDERSSTFRCRLVQHNHAKVIWWRGVGLYIGSADLNHGDWYKNIEAGCFFEEDEVTDEIAAQIHDMFAALEEHSTPLTEEVLRECSNRERELFPFHSGANKFLDSPSFKTWPALVQTTEKNATDSRRKTFLEEWHSTLQDLRDIGAAISKPENQPSWINPKAPMGSQADQFLHAHYYNRTFDEGRAGYARLFEANRGRHQQALNEAIAWWHELPAAPSQEDVMLNETCPFLRAALARDALATMDYDTFKDVCFRVHAIKDYSRRVANKAVALPVRQSRYTISEKVAALSKRIWNDQSSGGIKVRELFDHVLYGGSSENLPERLWQAVADPKWKIDGLGISALGELVGWALPDQFPPRNGRTSKALKSLGYDVTLHVE